MSGEQLRLWRLAPGQSLSTWKQARAPPLGLLDVVRSVIWRKTTNHCPALTRPAWAVACT